MDIKLKNKLLEWAKTIFIWGIGVLLCFVLYYLVDDFFNGSFVDWFDGNYMVTQYAYIEEAERRERGDRNGGRDNRPGRSGREGNGGGNRTPRRRPDA